MIINRPSHPNKVRCVPFTQNLQRELSDIYQAYGMRLKHFFLEQESKCYQACRFELNGKKIVFRCAKITPKKTGQFVTIWKRIERTPIQPLSHVDSIDFVVIHVQKKKKMGQFIFPFQVLSEKGIITTPSKEGKKGIRVYPPWDNPTSHQAQKTQHWQQDHFFLMSEPPEDIHRFKRKFERKKEELS